MATLATLYDWLFETKTMEEAAPRVLGRDGADVYRLRALPYEEVYLWVKQVDNSRVVRAANPRSAGACWRFIGAASMAAMVLVGLLLPNVYGLLAGYQIHALERERQVLLEERAALERDEARLLSPERLEELARIQALVDPPPESVVHLTPQADGSLAMNAGKSR